MNGFGELFLAIELCAAWRIQHPGAAESRVDTRGGQARRAAWSNEYLADRIRLLEWRESRGNPGRRQ